MSFARLRLAICCFAGVIASCSAFETHDCTEIGCSDGLAFSLRTPTGRWEDGQYALVIEGDVQPGPVTCQFRMPDDIPVLGSSTEVHCSDSLSLQLAQDSKCDPPPMNARNLEPCVPLSGQFVLSGGIEGTPKELQLSLTRDGTSILSRTVRPSYERTRPNGPDCAPVCDRADESITF